MTTLKISKATDISNTVTGSSCGYSLTEANYYSDPIFLNIMKATSTLSNVETYDANGYPTALVDGATNYQTTFCSGGTPDTPHRGGTFLLTWDGEDANGTLGGGGVTVLNNSPNALTFVLDGTYGGNSFFKLFPNNPQDIGPDYPRNFKCLRTHDHLGNPVTDIADYEAGEIFRSEFLTLIQDLPIIRTINLTKANGTGEEDWANRPRMDDLTWVNNIPWEAVIEMCNRFNITPWFQPQGVVSDDYIRQLAILARDMLDNGIVPIFEMGNECWNPAFGVVYEFKQRATAAWPAIDYDSSFISWYAKRTTEMSIIVRDVFGSRPVRTTFDWQQSGYGSGFDPVLMGATWRSYEPGDTYSPGYDQVPETREGVWTGVGDLLPHEVHDAVAVTSYFGNGVLSTNETQLVTDFGVGDAAGIAAAAATILAACPAAITSMLANVSNWKSVCEDVVGVRSVPLDIYIYEGNHHINPQEVKGTTLWDGTEDDFITVNGTSFHQAMEAAIYSDTMAGYQEDMLNGLKSIGVKNIALYELLNMPSKYNYWGFLRYYGDTNVMAGRVNAWSTSNQRWWLQ